MAQALGTRYVIIPIQEVVDKTIEQLGQTPIHNYATGEDSKLTITPFATENIQARDRGARVIAGLAASFGGGFSLPASWPFWEICGSTRSTPWATT